MLFHIAHELKKTVIEIMQMPAIEVAYWSAYFEIIRRDNERYESNNFRHGSGKFGPKGY